MHTGTQSKSDMLSARGVYSEKSDFPLYLNTCVWTKKWLKTYGGAEAPLNRGWIWTQHA